MADNESNDELRPLKTNGCSWPLSYYQVSIAVSVIMQWILFYIWLIILNDDLFLLIFGLAYGLSLLTLIILFVKPTVVNPTDDVVLAHRKSQITQDDDFMFNPWKHDFCNYWQAYSMK